VTCTSSSLGPACTATEIQVEAFASALRLDQCYTGRSHWKGPLQCLTSNRFQGSQGGYCLLISLVIRGQTLFSGAQQDDKGQQAQTEAEEVPSEHEEELLPSEGD